LQLLQAVSRSAGRRRRFGSWILKRRWLFGPIPSRPADSALAGPVDARRIDEIDAEPQGVQDVSTACSSLTRAARFPESQAIGLKSVLPMIILSIGAISEDGPFLY